MSMVAANREQRAYEAPISSSDELVYQSVSRSAVASMVLGALGLLSFVFVGLLLLPIAGLLLGISALLAIRKYPGELLGKPVAWMGVALSGFTLCGAPAYHAYVYATEVPPGYQRIAFGSLISPTGAPDLPPAQALELDGQDVFIKGYIHPTSMDSPRAKKFVLVPDLGTCCFGGQPPLTHMIEVTLTGDSYATKSLRKLKLAGTLHVNRALKPIDGLEGVYYTLKADYIR
ncbi:MAG: DUF3299 domain-containing protein [Aureliella sp.]